MAEVWVALLRGINLGPRNRVPMAGLREVFEAAGCGSVKTYIASGNVVFAKQAADRNALGRKLERAVADAFDVETPIVLRTAKEIRKVVDSHPFGRDTSNTYVTFLVNKPTAAGVRRLAEADVSPDEVEVAGSDVYLRYPNGLQGSRLNGALLEKHLGVAGTNRNWRTVSKLVDLAEAASS